jgi:hypothetical protein
VTKPGYVLNPVRNIAERRARWKTKRNLVIPKDNPQSRFIRSRLMEALHFSLLWSGRRAGARKRAAVKVVAGLARLYSAQQNKNEHDD